MSAGLGYCFSRFSPKDALKKEQKSLTSYLIIASVVYLGLFVFYAYWFWKISLEF